MPDEQVATQQTEQSQSQELQSSSEDQDLISRASEVSIEKPQETEAKYDSNALNEHLSKLPPEVQEQVKAYQASIRRGADEKFQEAARMRAEAEQRAQRSWDKNSVQELLNDPTFQAQVNQLQQERQLQQNPEGSGLSDEEWSYLSPKEKSLLFDTRKAQMEDRARMNQFFQRQEWEKQDLQIKSRFKNYDPKSVDEVFQGLMSGKIQATREHLWKVVDYDSAVKRAYELGKKDRALDLNEKVQASSPAQGLNAHQSKDVPMRGEKENGVEYFKRLALQNAKKLGIKI